MMMSQATRNYDYGYFLMDHYPSAGRTSKHQYESHPQYNNNTSESRSAVHRLFAMRDPGSQISTSLRCMVDRTRDMARRLIET